MPSNIYRHTSEITLDEFIRIIDTKDLKILLKYGSASKHNLGEAWEQIFSEYCEQSGTAQFRNALTLVREIGQLESKILCIRTCLTVLAYRYSEKCITILKQRGYNYKFDPNDPESYNHDLKCIAAKSKTLEIILAKKRVEYEELQKGLDTTKEITGDHFTDMIAMLSKYVQYHINRKEITVSEFCAIRRMYDKEIEYLKSEEHLKKFKK